jgi:hypothetical protein
MIVGLDGVKEFIDVKEEMPGESGVRHCGCRQVWNHDRRRCLYCRGRIIRVLGNVQAGRAQSIGEQNSASSCARAAASGFSARSPG